MGRHEKIEQADSCSGYHRFIAEDGAQYGSFEVFCTGLGWYWWCAQPGYIPDGEPFGPFKSSREAMNDARAL